jgi:catechol 2,3-dioxygenase-like lactoylglutathione lyase family enzyme
VYESRETQIDEAANDTASQCDATRRVVIGGALGLAALPLLSGAARAQTANADVVARQMPLRGVVGLEHIGTTVPDVTPAARFFGRVFNPFLYKEQDPPLRYYVTLDPGYIALGGNAQRTRGFIDHDCIFAEGYDRDAMALRLEQEGMEQGGRGIFPDPDGIRLQLLARNGLALTTEPAGILFDGEPLLRPRGLYRVLRVVADLNRSLAFYRKLLGPEAGADAEGTWFDVGPTRFGLRQGVAGEAARIDRFGVNVSDAGYDRDKVAEALVKLGATIPREQGSLLHFVSPEGIGVELRPVDPAKIWGRT